MPQSERGAVSHSTSNKLLAWIGSRGGGEITIRPWVGRARTIGHVPKHRRGGESMGILYPEASMMWQARLTAGPFREILTIGHQVLFLYPREVRLLRYSYRSRFPDTTGTPLSGYLFGSYSDGFLKEFLGAESISILDC